MKQVTKEQCIDGQFYWVTEPHHGNQTVAKCVDMYAHNRVEFRDTAGTDETVPFEWYKSVHGPIPTPSTPVCSCCGTHEIELIKVCHNSSCELYASEETILRGWEVQP